MIRLVLGRSPARAPHLRERAIPDSALCVEALDHGREVLSPAVLNHSLRCWVWADIFAQIDGVGYDAEELFAVCVLHDVGLGAPATDEYGCFTHISAAHADDLVARVGTPDTSSQTISEAIRLHMDLTVDREAGAEAYLLHAAAHCDVAGRRAHELSRADVDATVARYPRIGFIEEFTQSMRREVKLRPKSRAATLWRSGMALPLRTNPLDWTSR